LEAGFVPVEVLDVDEFVRLSEKAAQCLVKKTKKETKLKLRTKNELYTMKVDPKETDEVLKKLKCETTEA
jgi:hypothetical protein